MVVVTGTKRSGTSMWMQVLLAAGLPTLGKPFPGRWKDTIADANPGGFYEGVYRRGINFTTNPHPKTGEYLSPADTRTHAVKVFVPGLRRSDLAYLDRVIVTVRPIREYCHSLERLYAMEHVSRNRLDGRNRSRSQVLHPALEWWSEMHGVLADVLRRQLPAHFVAYDTILAEPVGTVREVIAWIGTGDAEAGARVVSAERRTQHAVSEPVFPDVMTEEHLRVCDELYARVLSRRGIDAGFIDRLNAVDEVLDPWIRAENRRLREVRLAKRRRAEERAT